MTVRRLNQIILTPCLMSPQYNVTMIMMFCWIYNYQVNDEGIIDKVVAQLESWRNRYQIHFNLCTFHRICLPHFSLDKHLWSYNINEQCTSVLCYATFIGHSLIHVHFIGNKMLKNIFLIPALRWTRRTISKLRCFVLARFLVS